MNRFLLNLYLLILLCSISQSSFGQSRYYVSPSGSNNGGTSWHDAVQDLQEAIDSAATGDTIWVAEGTYLPTKEFDGDASGGSDPRERTFYISRNIKIFGGFSASDTMAARDVELYPTLLSGDVGIDGDSIDNCYHVVFIDGRTANGDITSECMLDGFTILSGNANDSPINGWGGGVLNMGSNATASPSVFHCTFLNNFALNGGGIYNYGGDAGMSSPIISHCRFEDNSSEREGGAIYNYGHIFGVSSPAISHSHFISNRAGDDGGAISNDSGDSGICSALITNCSFFDNRALNGNGGCIFNKSREVGVSSPVFNSCVFNESTAALNGGVISNYSDGGISSPSFTNCTFCDNAAGLFGGAISSLSVSGTTNLLLINCILWNNGDEIFGGTVLLSHCLFDDGTPGNGTIIYPSGVVNGGNNLDDHPLFLDEINGNFRLQNHSPGINAGDNTAISEMYDLDELPRKNGVVDIGAFENPHVNCPDTIWIGSNYSPLQGLYAAKTEIQLSENVQILLASTVTMSAPSVQLLPVSQFDLGAIVTIDSQGCNP